MLKPGILVCLQLLVALLWAKPPAGFTAHPDGMFYQIIRNSADSARPVFGDYIFMHLAKHHPEKNEVFNTHIFNAHDGVEFLLERPVKFPDVTQVFTLMSSGDSAVVKIPAHLVDSNGSKNKFYTYYLRLVSFESKAQHDIKQEIALNTQRSNDAVLIQNFLNTRSIDDAEEDSRGMFYKKTKPTNQDLLQNGDTVTIHYKGSLVNGFEFDNSYYREQPLSFVVGKKQVIDGLDMAMTYFRKEESGIIIIPSYLGYGSREAGKIPPNSVLVFEIEILP